MHPEPAMVVRPVTQAVARYQAVVAQIRAGNAAIAARIHADEQASGTVLAKRFIGDAAAHPLPGPFANAAKGANISSIKP